MGNPIYDSLRGSRDGGSTIYDELRHSGGQYTPRPSPESEVGMFMPGGITEYDTRVQRADLYDPNRILMERSQNQPWSDQALGAINQAVIGEVIGGTIMSAGALLGLPKAIMGEFDKGKADFHNALFDIGKNISDWSRGATPIHQTPYRDFTDKDFLSGWFYGNLPSVASVASSFIPGLAVSRGVRWAGEFMKLSELATGLIETGLGAVAMRHAENYREASGVYDYAKQMALDKGMDEKQAEKVARDASYLDYNANAVNIIFDLVQLGSALKPFKAMTRNVGVDYDVAKAIGKLPESSIGRKGYWMMDKILPQTGESVEETINTISQFEGERRARIDAGVEKDDGTDFVTRVGEYIGRPETKDAALWGFAGGVISQSVLSKMGFDEGAGMIAKKEAEIAERSDVVRDYSNTLSEIANDQTLTDEQKAGEVLSVQKDMVQDLGFRAAKAGNVDILLEYVQHPDFAKEMATMGFGEEEEVKQRIPELVKEIETAERVYSKQYNRFVGARMDNRIKDIVIDQSTRLDLQREKNNKVLSDLVASESEIRGEDEYFKNVIMKNADPQVALDYNNRINRYALSYAITELGSSLTKPMGDISASRIKKAMDILNKKYELSTLGVSKIDDTAISSKLINNRKEQEIVNAYNDVLGEEMATLQTEKGQKDIVNNIEESIKTVKENKTKADEARAALLKNERVSSYHEVEAWEPLEPVSKKEFDDAVDNNNVRFERLVDIAVKIKDGVRTGALSKEEQAIFDMKTAEINDLLRQIQEAETNQQSAKQEVETEKITEAPVEEAPTPEVKKEVRVNPQTKQPEYKEVDGDKQEEGAASSLAYLSRNYVMVDGKRIDQDFVQEHLHIALPETMKPGTKVELRIPEGTDISESYRTIPIAVYVDGKNTGTFLHKVSWVNDANVVGKHIEKEKADLDKIRKVLVEKLKDGGAYKTTVVSKSSGRLLFSEKRRTLAEKIKPETKFYFGYVHTNGNIKVVNDNGDIRDGDSNPKLDVYKPDPALRGKTVVLVETTTSKLGEKVYKHVVVDNTRLSSDNEYAKQIRNSIVEAFKVYIGVSNKNANFGDEIKTLGFKDMQDYVESFVYNTNENDGDNKRTMREYVASRKDGMTKPLFSMRNGKLDIVILGKVYNFKLGKDGQIAASRDGVELQEGEKMLRDTLSFSDMNGLLFRSNMEKGRVVRLIPIMDGKNIKTVPYRDILMNMLQTNLELMDVDGRQVFSIQHVIKMDFDDILIDKPTVSKMEIVSPTKVVEIDANDITLDDINISEEEAKERIKKCE